MNAVVRQHIRNGKVVKQHTRKSSKERKNRAALDNAKHRLEFSGLDERAKLQVARDKTKHGGIKNLAQDRISRKGRGEQSNSWQPGKSKPRTKQERGKMLHHIDRVFHNPQAKKKLKKDYRNKK